MEARPRRLGGAQEPAAAARRGAELVELDAQREELRAMTRIPGVRGRHIRRGQRIRQHAHLHAAAPELAQGVGHLGGGDEVWRHDGDAP